MLADFPIFSLLYFANFILLHFARQCSDRSEVWWAMRHAFCCKFPVEYDSERTLKIGQHLSTLLANVQHHSFLFLCVYTSARPTNTLQSVENVRKVPYISVYFRILMYISETNPINRSSSTSNSLFYRVTRQVMNDFDFKFKPVINSNQQ